MNTVKNDTDFARPQPTAIIRLQAHGLQIELSIGLDPAALTPPGESPSDVFPYAKGLQSSLSLAASQAAAAVPELLAVFQRGHLAVLVSQRDLRAKELDDRRDQAAGGTISIKVPA